MIIIWNKLSEKQKIKILQILKNNVWNFTIYNFLDNFDISENDIMKYFEDESKLFFDLIGKYLNDYSYFNYFRHIMINKEKLK